MRNFASCIPPWDRSDISAPWVFLRGFRRWPEAMSSHQGGLGSAASCPQLDGDEVLPCRRLRAPRRGSSPRLPPPRCRPSGVACRRGACRLASRQGVNLPRGARTGGSTTLAPHRPSTSPALGFAGHRRSRGEGFSPLSTGKVAASRGESKGLGRSTQRSGQTLI